MKYFKMKHLAVLAIVVSVFAACTKVDKVDPLGERGQTIVKLMDGGPVAYALGSQVGDDDDGPGLPNYGVAFVNTPQSVTVLSIRRDVPNSEELNKRMTVVIQEDTSLIRIYNDTADLRGNALIDTLPVNTFSISPAKVGGYNGTYTIEFAPGEVAKEIVLTVNNPSADLDPNVTYALAFKIVSVNVDGGTGNIGFSQAVVAKIGAKNKYDGIYKVTGTFQDVTNANFFGNYPREYYLITTGANSVDVCQIINGDIVPGYLFLNGTAGTYFGSFGLTMTFNPANDVIADLHNYYGDPTKAANAVGNPGTGTGAPLYAASNTRRAVLDPAGFNAYNESTKTVDIKYHLVQPNVVAVGPRALISETWVYDRSR